MVGTNATGLDILINSQFIPTGFTRAMTMINSFVQTVNKANSSLQTMNGTATQVNTGMKNVGTETNKTTKQMASITQQAGKTAEAYRNMAFGQKLAREGTSYLGQAINSQTAQLNGAIAQTRNYSYATKAWSLESTVATQQASSGFGNFVGNVSSGVSAIKGYFGGLIQQTISVGDIFGYYIGMLALQAIYDFVFGVSVMRDEMETMFEYMGMGKAAVESFSNELTEFAVRMPTISIGGVNAIARTLAMGGADMMEIAKYKQTWGDMAEIAAALNGISAEAAAAKVGPAITDAMSGQYKRLMNVMNVTSSQFKAKAAEMGIDAEGSFSKTMQVIQAILEERGLAGVAAKITSIGDAWNYLTELLSFKGSQIGDTLLPMIKSALWALATVLEAVPTPLLAIGAAFVALAAGMMVILPFLSSFVNGFNLVKLAVQPVTQRVRDMKKEFQGFEKILGLTNKEFETLDKMSKKQLEGVGVVRKTKIDPFAPGGKRTIYYEQKFIGDDDAESSYLKMKKSGKGFDDQLKEQTKTLKKYESGLKSSGKSVDGLGTKMKNLGGGVKSLGMAFIATPIGIILAIITAIFTIITLTDSWGRISALMTKIMQALADALEPVAAWIADIAEKTWASIEAWEGWDDVKQWIVNAKNELIGLYNWVNQNVRSKPKEGEKEGAVKPGFGIPILSQTTTLWQDFFTGSDATKGLNNELTGLYGTLILLTNPLTVGPTLVTLFATAMDRFKFAVAEITKQDPSFFINFNTVLGQLGIAWHDLAMSVEYAYAAMKPAFDELGTAIGTLMDTISGPDMKGVSDAIGAMGAGGKDSAEKLSPFAQVLKLIVDIITVGLQIAIGIIKIFTGVIWVAAMVMGGFSVIASAITYAINGLILAWQTLWPVMLFIIAPFQALLGAIILLWHWIWGGSPGLIPAIRLLAAVIIGVMPGAIMAFSAWLSNGIAWAMRFVNSVYGWFKLLPGRVYSALVGIKTSIINQLSNAYNGAKSWVSKFYAIGTSIKNYVVNGIKNALGIRSPSKETYSLGEAISQGLFYGMSDWVKDNASSFSTYVAKQGSAGAKILADVFSKYNWVMYYNSMQSVNKTLSTMTGNCYDAALAYQALANKIGLVANLSNTTVHGIPHTVIDLPTLGMWIDPSGILGTGLKPGHAPSGAPNIVVYVQENEIKDDLDLDKIGKATSTKIVNAVRFGI